jgi:hypothetical protein
MVACSAATNTVVHTHTDPALAWQVGTDTLRQPPRLLAQSFVRWPPGRPFDCSCMKALAAICCTKQVAKCSRPRHSALAPLHCYSLHSLVPPTAGQKMYWQVPDGVDCCCIRPRCSRCRHRPAPCYCCCRCCLVLSPRCWSGGGLSACTYICYAQLNTQPSDDVQMPDAKPLCPFSRIFGRHVKPDAMEH